MDISTFFLERLARSGSILGLLLLMTTAVFAQPDGWTSTGIGGGGALFSPSISPHNSSDIYVACDMSEMFHSTDFGGTWNVADFRRLQTGSIGGTVQFTSDPNVLYTIDARNDAGTPVKSTDGGTTWSALGDDPTEADAYSLFADPAGTTRLLVSDYFSLYFSTDGGASFTTVYESFEGLYIAGAFFDGQNIYVGTNYGLLQSIDGGTTFGLASVGGIPTDEAMVSFAAARQGNSLRMFCVTLGSGDVYPGVTGSDHIYYMGVYRLDGGQTAWQRTVSGIPTGTYPFFVAMARNNVDVAYLAGGSDDYAPVVFKTASGGTSWQSVFATTNNQNIRTGWSGQGGDRGWSYGEYPLGLAVSPTDPGRVIVTDLGFAHLSSDGGTTWSQGYVAAQFQNPQGSPTPKGKSYSGNGLENTTSWWLEWADADNLVACFADIRGIRSSDGGTTWSHPYDGFTFNATYHVVKHPGTGALYAATSTVHDLYQSTYLTDQRIDGGKGGVIVSTDKGATWSTLHDFGHPVVWLAIDPSDPNTMYASVVHSTQGGVFVSHDLQNGAGATWTRLAVPPRTEGHPFNIHVLDDGMLVATYSGRRTVTPAAFTNSSGVFVSTDGGTSWSDRSAPQMLYWTKDLVVDPHDQTQNTWYAGVWSGWGGEPNELGGLYRTTDRGLSWSLLLDLPSKADNTNRVTSCTVSPTDPDEMYVTTETDGLWYTKNLTASTPTFAQVQGYPFRQPERVFYNPYKSGEVWVTSFGNGLRRAGGGAVQVPAAPTLLAPANGATDIASSGTVQWSSVAGAISYRVQISPTFDFAAPTLDQQGVTSTSQTFSGLTAGTTYYWRVAASNGSGTGSWSDVWSFATAQDGPAAPAAPQLVAPVDQATEVGLSGVLSWGASAGAESYHVQIATTSDFSTVVLDQESASTSLSYSGLTPETTYYWRVQASNASGTGPWSTIWSFTTISGTTDAETGPTIPVSLALRSYPNPASDAVSLEVRLPARTRLSVRLTDLNGRTAGPVIDGEYDAGVRTIGLSLEGVPNGIYCCRVRAGGETVVEMISVVR